MPLMMHERQVDSIFSEDIYVVDSAFLFFIGVLHIAGEIFRPRYDCRTPDCIVKKNTNLGDDTQRQDEGSQFTYGLRYNATAEHLGLSPAVRKPDVLEGTITNAPATNNAADINVRKRLLIVEPVKPVNPISLSAITAPHQHDMATRANVPISRVFGPYGLQHNATAEHLGLSPGVTKPGVLKGTSIDAPTTTKATDVLPQFTHPS
nr:hypothetical protein [Tanacetum cinerariifolium]